ncbi:adenosylcobinamide-phosphate synthase CbiB [Halomonas sp. M4R1S46]|uniref:adenosylcobinamide-phosphate synthase CbiB n=1 Tax=Halomonas sp. M4R1S46 TaxID=2982692 RepID=UPI0021E41D67|nr:adenosylcobinamide-phosphate synthase CbiB [Halomonas sp. M4R1S46]UYG08736.1 adenosylcobinamide-phosphate synthase CbiB [Halomonas sp. M4R1S46]
MTLAPLSWELLALIGAALAIDLLLGDPPWLPHPVVGIGRVIARLERAWNQGPAAARRRRGIWLAVLVVGGTWALSWGLLACLAWLSPWLAVAAELGLLATALAARGLAEAARAVAEPLIRGALPEARQQLARIVGRDTADLDEAELARGAVETVAENTVDGITAPLFWALLGGAPLALAYKAANTLDSMVGYRSPRFMDFGRASARLDDAVNWLPARLTALSLWLAARAIPGSRRAGALAATRREASRHPSPNAGWPEAMVANLMGVRLGGLNHYAGRPSPRATLGTPHEVLTAGHIERAIRHMHGGWLAFLLLATPLVLVQEWLT